MVSHDLLDASAGWRPRADEPGRILAPVSGRGTAPDRGLALACGNRIPVEVEPVAP